MAFSDLLATVDRAVLQRLGSGTLRYTPERGEPADVGGVFDAAYVLADTNGARLSSAGPAAFFLLADLPSDPSEDDAVVTVAGTNYRIREAQKDGQGGVLLLLREA